MIESLAGKRVTVVGLGRFGGGLGVTRWLAKQGAHVTVSDRSSAEDLAESVAALADTDVALHLGEHARDDFVGAEMLVVNPAVPPEMPLLADAQAAGVRMTTEINLFLARCPAAVVGVTGSVGKSTTTAMIGQILSQVRATHVGGNIGRCLLEELDEIRADDAVVLELSSFQLERLAWLGVSPAVAVVTNLRANHLDRHGTMAAYAAAKQNIYAFQSDGDVLIVNAADPDVSRWRGPGRTVTFDPASEPFELSVPGAHNQANAQAAAAAAGQLGVDRAIAAEALKRFTGLPHRLQFVTECDGVRFFNDSKCTTPDGAIVALEAFEPRRVVIILGGYDKHVSFDALGKAAAARAKAIVVIGATQGQIVEAVESQRDGDMPTVIRAETLQEAVAQAKRRAADGDVLLLSPACASYDMFTNYEQRGQAFIDLSGR